MFFCIIFCSPFYFLIRKKWLGFIVNSVLYGIALLCLLSIIGIWIAPFFWVFAVAHAKFAYRKDATERHAELIATKMAEKLQESRK